MDMEPPSLEVSTKGTEEGPYDISREDVEGDCASTVARWEVTLLNLRL